MRDASIVDGNFFIVGGQLAYVADMAAAIKAPNGESDARLRVVYANGTQSNLLRRSLQRALYKDDTGRRLTEPDMGPLFGDAPEPEDIESGCIYVLRSLSSHPFVAEHREVDSQDRGDWRQGGDPHCRRGKGRHLFVGRR